MTPLNYYLWNAFKDKCYADKLETIDALKDNIREAIGEIHLHTIDNAFKNWNDCVGSYLNEINEFRTAATRLEGCVSASCASTPVGHTHP